MCVRTIRSISSLYKGDLSFSKTASGSSYIASPLTFFFARPAGEGADRLDFLFAGAIVRDSGASDGKPTVLFSQSIWLSINSCSFQVLSYLWKGASVELFSVQLCKATPGEVARASG